MKDSVADAREYHAAERVWLAHERAQQRDRTERESDGIHARHLASGVAAIGCVASAGAQRRNMREQVARHVAVVVRVVRLARVAVSGQVVRHDRAPRIGEQVDEPRASPRVVERARPAVHENEGPSGSHRSFIFTVRSTVTTFRSAAARLASLPLGSLGRSVRRRKGVQRCSF